MQLTYALFFRVHAILRSLSLALSLQRLRLVCECRECFVFAAALHFALEMRRRRTSPSLAAAVGTAIV